MAMVSPLHRAIDAGRWDAESLLGRLIIIVHAAFLDWGFLPLHHGSPSRLSGGPVPREAVQTASALSLRYRARQLLHRQDAAEAAVLRILAHGRSHLILYVQCGPWPVERCVLVDALAAAPLLAGGLDRTARALRSDAGLAGLWSRFSGDLCRRALVDMCGRAGVALEPTLMSLDVDVKAAILARLTDGVDLASVEGVCTELRHLVADRDRELWKPVHDAMRRASWFYPGCGGHAPETRWKERYVSVRRWRLPPSLLGTVRSWCHLGDNGGVIRPYLRCPYPPSFVYDSFLLRRQADREDAQEQAADPVANRRKRAADGRGGKHAARRRHQTPPSRGPENRRRSAGAIHAPSSRYRWRHR